MTREEKADLFATLVDPHALHEFNTYQIAVLDRIIAALPVTDPAPVAERRTGRACPCGEYMVGEVQLVGVEPNGTVSLKYGSIYHVCPPQVDAAPTELEAAVDGMLLAMNGLVLTGDGPQTTRAKDAIAAVRAAMGRGK